VRSSGAAATPSIGNHADNEEEDPRHQPRPGSRYWSEPLAVAVCQDTVPGPLRSTFCQHAHVTNGEVGTLWGCVDWDDTAGTIWGDS
jgi:hypothetical protein